MKINKRDFVRVCFMVPVMALVLCSTSQFVRYGGIQPNLLAKSLPVGFLCAFFCNLCLPLGKNAVWMAKHLPVQTETKKFGWVVSFCFSIQFAAIMTCVMSFYNVVLLGHQPMLIFFKSWAKVYIPCLCMAYFVSSLWKPQADKLAWKLVPLQEGEAAPTMHPEQQKQLEEEKSVCLPGEPCWDAK
jgi:hypothetical protein